MELGFFIGFGAMLLIFLWLTITACMEAGKAEKSGKAKGTSATVVAGAIIGTLVGGSSTIGTAQLAYTYGMSAWWFTLGSGISCLVLGLGFTKAFRNKCKNTLTGMISDTFGPAVGMAATSFSVVGMFISILAQMLSAAAIVMMILPNIPLLGGVMISAALMVLYALSGGVSGLGKIGVFKTILLYVTTIGGGLMALSLFGGFQELISDPVLTEGHYFGLFNRGMGRDLGNGLSVVLGVLSTQTYIQAIQAGRDDRTARNGALIGAVMIPPIGIGGILIGMYMRVYHPELTVTKFALPQFVMEYMPGPMAGIIFATLLLTTLGTGAGMALGIGTTIRRDLIINGVRQFSDRVKELFTERRLIVLTLFLAALIGSSGIGDFILDFSFMSMALRAAVVFVPMMFILAGKTTVPSKYVLVSVIAGPAAVLAGKFMNLPFDSLFLGIAVNLVVLTLGYMRGKSAEAVK